LLRAADLQLGDDQGDAERCHVSAERS
jgi:hypothetical protein